MAVVELTGGRREVSYAALRAMADRLALGLVARGVREITLIAQDSTAYGADIYGRPRLCDLLQRLDDLDMDSSGGFWHANGEALPW